jgi:hypothetical protein
MMQVEKTKFALLFLHLVSVVMIFCPTYTLLLLHGTQCMITSHELQQGWKLHAKLNLAAYAPADLRFIQ